MTNKPTPDNNAEWRPNSELPDHLKRLEHQIKHDQAQPVKSFEKRVKLNTSFEDAVQQLSRTPKDK